MPVFEILSLIALAALAWFWLDSLRARDSGILAVRTACAGENLQLLDDTVSIARLAPARNDQGRIVFRRTYAFEYSDTGNNRHPGSVVLLGRQVAVINIGLHGEPAQWTLH